MTTPNRLEINWEKIKPLILLRWPRLTRADLDAIDCEFDRLVEAVKQRYDDPVQTVKEAHVRHEVLAMLKEIEEPSP